MATIEIEADWYIDEVSNSKLLAEVARRVAVGDITPAMAADDSEPWSPDGLASDIRHAFYARDASRMEMLLTVLERHQGRVGPHATQHPRG